MTIDINAIPWSFTTPLSNALVDRVLEVSEDEITAIKNVTINEPFLMDIFLPSYAWRSHQKLFAQTKLQVLELSKPGKQGQISLLCR